MYKKSRKNKAAAASYIHCILDQKHPRGGEDRVDGESREDDLTSCLF